MGSLSLNGLNAGDYNTAVGNQAGPFGNNVSNSAAFGYNAHPSGSNQIVIGNANITSIGGYAGWTNVSDARFKTQVQENVPGLEFIIQLRPVTYHLNVEKLENFLHIPDSLDNSEFLKKSKKEKAAIVQTGFIAQEVEQAARSIGYDFSGVDAPKNENDHYGLRYAEFVVPLVKAVQELEKENKGLKSENDNLKSRLEAIESLLNITK